MDSPSVFTLPLVKANENVPEGMLPEDPLTSFYQHEDGNQVLLEEGEMGTWSAADRLQLIIDDDPPIDQPSTTITSQKTPFGESPNHDLNQPFAAMEQIQSFNKSLSSMLIFVELGDRYNLINCLGTYIFILFYYNNCTYTHF